ncbi:MAG: hypothetical protein ACLTV1_07480, partial [Christensenellales bacterium]
MHIILRLLLPLRPFKLTFTTGLALHFQVQVAAHHSAVLKKCCISITLGTGVAAPPAAKALYLCCSSPHFCLRFLF